MVKHLTLLDYILVNYTMISNPKKLSEPVYEKQALDGMSTEKTPEVISSLLLRFLGTFGMAGYSA